MKETFSLFKPRKLGTVLIGRKTLTQFFGVFVFLMMGLLSFSIVEANDFELALQDLGNKSRTKIKKAIKELGNQGNPAALPALEALKGNRLRISDDGILIILNDSGD